MTTRPTSPLRQALALLTARLVLQQIGLALLVLALFAVWLRIPDASAVDVIGSVLLAVIVLAVAGAGQASLFLRLCPQPRSMRGLVRGALAILLAVALWFAWDILLIRIEAHNQLRAGYLNSRFPHSMRNLFSYGHLLLWLTWIGTALRWIGGGVLGIAAFAALTAPHPARSAWAALRSGTYWIALLAGGTLANVLTNRLLHWTPGHGLHREMLGLAIRLVLVALLNGTVVSLLLTILAARICGIDSRYAIPGGTPDVSQPRTAANP